MKDIIDLPNTPLSITYVQGLYYDIRYKSALDDTLIGIENLNSGYLTHRISDP